LELSRVLAGLDFDPLEHYFTRPCRTAVSV
jgi:hypothetical protein